MGFLFQLPSTSPISDSLLTQHALRKLGDGKVVRVVVTTFKTPIGVLGGDRELSETTASPRHKVGKGRQMDLLFQCFQVHISL